MENEVSTATCRTRERVVLFLAFLSSEECLNVCHRFLAPEKLGVELCRLWFDEIYVPSTRYLDGLKGDRSEAAVQRFQECFTGPERAALERFHRFLELRIDMLSGTPGPPAYLPQNDAWRNIMKDASHVLDELEPEPERLRSRLVETVQILVGRGAGGALSHAPARRDTLRLITQTDPSSLLKQRH